MNKDQEQIAEAEYIFGMFVGLQAGFRTVEDVFDRIMEFINDKDEVCPLCLKKNHCLCFLRQP